MAERKQQLGLVALLIELGRSYGRFSADEERFLLALARGWQIAEEEIYRALQDGPQARYHPPPEEHQRIVDFQTLVYFAFSDGSIHQSEVRFLKNSGLRMGLHPVTIKEIIQLTDQYYPETVPTPTLKQTYMRFSN